ncbi:hypothetical protein D1155_13205 [Anaerotruncus sp. 80]|jgi:transposase|uniref:Transposase IS204/IS1001/IS1096/IS1165 DDE domain-containing protein n=1 Tax=Anaerotruncus colihominis TaxID=169435 RepID=A0A845QN23_9FIRM|nr:hypothetical protein [Anaerotruncus colihominis]NCF03260.1 hypothetical protein [Anaerotruncus sp. 80]
MNFLKQLSSFQHISNPKEKKVLDILPNRKTDALYQYFARYPNRNNVKYVVIDLGTLFRSAW